jgi:hypothetical protein
MPRGIPASKNAALGTTDDIEAKTLIPEFNEAGFDPSDIQIVSAKDFRSQAEEAKFMEEKVQIEIESDDKPNSPVFVYLGHNGISQYVQRGQIQTVKRKFLYSALAAKALKLTCEFGRDNAGNEYNRLNPSVSTTHRVRLVRDDNPQGGMDWVRKVLHSA